MGDDTKEKFFESIRELRGVDLFAICVASLVLFFAGILVSLGCGLCQKKKDDKEAAEKALNVEANAKSQVAPLKTSDKSAVAPSAKSITPAPKLSIVNESTKKASLRLDVKESKVAAAAAAPSDKEKPKQTSTTTPVAVAATPAAAAGTSPTTTPSAVKAPASAPAVKSAMPALGPKSSVKSAMPPLGKSPGAKADDAGPDMFKMSVVTKIQGARGGKSGPHGAMTPRTRNMDLDYVAGDNPAYQSLIDLDDVFDGKTGLAVATTKSGKSGKSGESGDQSGFSGEQSQSVAGSVYAKKQQSTKKKVKAKTKKKKK